MFTDMAGYPDASGAQPDEAIAPELFQERCRVTI
jgi:hypothetical protein